MNKSVPLGYKRAYPSTTAHRSRGVRCFIELLNVSFLQQGQV